MASFRKALWLVLLSELGSLPPVSAQNEKPQIVTQHNEEAHLPRMKSGISYDAQLRVTIPRGHDKSHVSNAEIHVANNLMRFDVSAYMMFSRTVWANLLNGKGIQKDTISFYHEIVETNFLLAGLDQLKVTQGPSEAVLDRMATVYNVEKQAVPGTVNAFEGKIYVWPNGVVPLVKGREKNLETCGTYEEITFRYTEYHERPQQSGQFKAPEIPKARNTVPPTLCPP